MIKTNSIQCTKCKDIIVSKNVHDFKFCKCGAVAVDGGTQYLKRCGNLEDWIELSEAYDNEKFNRKAYFESKERSKT